jgi:hypothetical protein
VKPVVEGWVSSSPEVEGSAVAVPFVGNIETEEEKVLVAVEEILKRRHQVSLDILPPRPAMCIISRCSSQGVLGQ